MPIASSGVAVEHDALHCAVTIREEATGKEIRRLVPDAGWNIQNSGRASVLLTVVPLAPARYRVTSLAAADSWEETSDGNEAFGYTDCRNRSLHERPVALPFTVGEGKVTLVAVPHGAMTFQDLSLAHSAMNNRYVAESIPGWLPKIRQALQARHAELVARQREPHEGYDVYRECDGRTAVVRTTGKPFPFVADLENQALRDAFRGRAMIGVLGVRSVHATGFGGACTGGIAFSVMMSDRNELGAAISGVGAWLIAEDFKGEVDLVVSGVPVEQ